MYIYNRYTNLEASRAESDSVAGAGCAYQGVEPLFAMGSL